MRIDNFLHVQHAELSFGEGLHCITGESGAGKTVVIKALKLLFGAKPPPHAIAENATQTLIEAAFDITDQKHIQSLLDQSGISYEADEWLLLKRILPREGKSKLFVNSQLTNASVVEALGKYLVEIVDQHAGKQLLSGEYQRKLLDSFGQHRPLLQSYSEKYTAHAAASALLNEMSENAPPPLDDLLWQKEELEKHGIDHLDIEKELKKHETFSHAEELADSLSQAVVTIKEHVTTQLQSMIRLIEKCAEKDTALTQMSDNFHTALLELDEGVTFGEQYIDQLEFDKEEFERLEELSTFLTLFKRKHDVSFEDISETYNSIIEKIEDAHSYQERIDSQRVTVENCYASLIQEGKNLSQARSQAAASLQYMVQNTLHTLKMDDASFGITVEEGEVKKHGCDAVCFTLERRGNTSPIKEVASGGELSRILLSLKAHIASKQTTPTLIFDEIDSNIGGETANVVADLLQQVATGQQLLTITHFPQVARRAAHHFVVEKEQSKQKSQGSIRLLPPDERQQELQRMVGGSESATLLVQK